MASLPCVYQNVPLQVITSKEPLATHTTRVNPLSPMSNKVPLQMVAPKEPLVAHAASIRPYIAVGYKMPLDSVDANETPSAQRTRMRLDGDVQQLLVPRDVVTSAEPCAANVARMGLALYVDLHVS